MLYFICGAKYVRRLDFIADNDLKYLAKIIKTFLNDNKISLMKWPVQSLNQNPIEMLQIDVDKYLKQQKPKHIEELFTAI